MADDTKTMWVILRAKNLTKAVWKDLEKTSSQSIKALKQGFNVLKGAVLAFAVAIKAGAIIAMKKLVRATVDLLKGAVQTKAQFEALILQFGVLMGSAEKGKKTFEDLWDVARRLPFTIDEIASAAKQLKAWGVVGEDIRVTMIGLADATALTGASMQTVANVIGRAWQMGTFLARGPGAMLRGIMQTKMGLDSTKLSVDEFRIALVKMLTDPKYGVAGMATKLATTFIGIRSMISDAVTNIKIMIAESGLFDEVVKTMSFFLDLLRSNEIINLFKRIGTIAGDVVKSFRLKLMEMLKTGALQELIEDWIRNIRNWAKTLKAFISGLPVIAETILNMITTLGIGFKKFVETFMEIIKVLEMFGIGESIESEANKANKALRSISDQLTKNAQEIIAYEEGIENYVKLWGDGNAKITNKIKDTIEKLKEQRKELLNQEEGIMKQVASYSKFMALLKDGFELNKNNNEAQKEYNKLLNKTDENLESLTDTWEKALSGFDLGEKKILTLTEMYDGFIEEFKDTFKGMADVAETTASTMTSAFENLFFDMMFGEFKGLLDYINQFMRDIGRMIAQRLAQMATMKLFSGFGGGETITGVTDVLGEAMERFKLGGIPRAQRGYPRGIDTMPVMVSPGEMILNRSQQTNLLKLLSGRGMGQGQGAIVNMYISSLDSKDTFRVLSKNMNAVGAVIQKGLLNRKKGF